MRRNWLMIVPPYWRSQSQTQLDERLAAELLARLALALELLLDHVLRRDARVVVARLEEAVEALHAVPATSASASESRSAWPMCSSPVTFGGGCATTKVGRRAGSGGVETLVLPGLLPALLDALRLVEGLHQPILVRRKPPTLRSNSPGRAGPQIRSGSDYGANYGPTCLGELFVLVAPRRRRS